MQINYNFEDKESKAYLTRQVTMARYALLVFVGLTLLNLALLVRGTGDYFLFSATVPYLLTAMGFVLDQLTGAGGPVGIYGGAALAVSAVVLGVYVLCMVCSRERPGWLAAGLVLAALDCIALLLVIAASGGLQAMALDCLLHGWVVYQLWQGFSAGKKLRMALSAGNAA